MTIARALTVAAFWTLAVVAPALMTIANKSLPLTLATGALLAGAAVALDGRWRAIGIGLLALGREPVARVLAALAILACASLAWSVAPSRGLRALGELTPVVVAGVVARVCLPRLAGPRLTRLLLAGVIAAAALVVLFRATGMPLHHLFGGRAMVLDLKRSVTPLALLVWPALALAPDRWRGPAGTVFALAAVAAAAIAATSGGALFGLLAGALAFGAARLAPRLAVALAGVCVAGALALAPLAGRATPNLLPDALERRLATISESFHVDHRVAIWSAFGARVAERPLLGHGFSASERVALAPRADGSPPDRPGEAVILNIHPHNAPLQIWVELGLAGALLAALLGAGVLARLWRLPGRDLAPRLACLAAASAIAYVGFSVWQAWLVASLAACAIWFAVAREAPGLRGARAP